MFSIFLLSCSFKFDIPPFLQGVSMFLFTLDENIFDNVNISLARISIVKMVGCAMFSQHER